MGRYTTAWAKARDEFDRMMAAQKASDQRTGCRLEGRIAAAAARMAGIERKAIADGDLHAQEALQLAIEIARWSNGEDGLAPEWSLVERALLAMKPPAITASAAAARTKLRNPAPTA